jgi:hypothetical protein
MSCLGIVLRTSEERACEIVRIVGPLRGGSKSLLLEDSQGSHWVAKLQNNPQGTAVLANEAFGAMLGQAIGLPFPHWSPVWVGSALLGGEAEGIHFASQFIPNAQGRRMSRMNCGNDSTDDHLFCGITIFDVWTMHCDDREFLQIGEDSPIFIDNGYLRFRSRNALNRVGLQRLQHLWRCNSSHLDNWVTEIENVSLASMEDMWQAIPNEWRRGRKSPAGYLRRRALLIAAALTRRNTHRYAPTRSFNQNFEM